MICLRPDMSLISRQFGFLEKKVDLVDEPRNLQANDERCIFAPAEGQENFEPGSFMGTTITTTTADFSDALD